MNPILEKIRQKKRKLTEEKEEIIPEVNNELENKKTKIIMMNEYTKSISQAIYNTYIIHI